MVTLKADRLNSFTTTMLTLIGVIGFAQLSWAQPDTARITSNIAPLGDICLAGDPCTAAPDAMAPAATPEPEAAPASAPEQVAETEPEPAPAATPAAAPAASDFDVAGTYQMRCFACHGTGAAGAPMAGDAEAWDERMAKGMDMVLANAINGIGAMPARGLCMDCTDDQIRELIDYMVEGQ